VGQHDRALSCLLSEVAGALLGGHGGGHAQWCGHAVSLAGKVSKVRSFSRGVIHGQHQRRRRPRRLVKLRLIAASAYAPTYTSDTSQGLLRGCSVVTKGCTMEWGTR